MKVLMFMRDALPPGRADVAVLFDIYLRELGIATDYVGHRGHSGAHQATPCHGGQFDTGARNDPRSVWREMRLLWRMAPRYDVVVVRDKPLAAGLLWAVAAWRGVRLVYWMSFPIPLGDRLGALHHWAAGRRWLGALTWLRSGLAQWVQDRIVLPRAAHVFVQSPRMGEVVRGSARIAHERVTAVPMGVDSRSLPDPRPDDATASARAPVVAYLGSLDRARELEVLVDAFALVRQRHPAATLLLVGSAPRDADVAWLKTYVERAGLAACVQFAGALPMHLAWQRVMAAAVCVSPVPPGDLHDVSSPTKVVEYLALGLPVVANDIPDQRDLLQACGGGLCVRFDRQAFADAIAALLDGPAAAHADARQARPKVLALRAYDVLAAQVAGTLRAALA